jgi:2-polyprenyl-6-methoxyphenol hydroxylase-like FAD-dependent oxidoreductase
MKDAVEVAIVGGGPSGLTVACELALAGVRVKVLERRTEPVGSRASTVMPRVLDLLDSRGLVERFLARAHEVGEKPLVGAHSWAGMMPVEFGHGETSFPFRLLLGQTYTEELLAERARELGVEIVQGAAVTAIAELEGGVVVQASHGDGTVSETQARYLVGADGGRSTVRTLSGIDFRGHEGTFTAVAVDVYSDFAFESTSRKVFANERGWLSILRFARQSNLTRIVMVHAERRKTSRGTPITIEEIETCFADIASSPIRISEIAWSSRFSDALKVADAFSKGRAYLVGEAVRIHYPASGVGMNYCIQDAFNLGWKLAAVVKGHARPELLDTYEAERRPVMEVFLESIAAQVSLQMDFSVQGMALKRLFERRLLPLPAVNQALGDDMNGLAVPYARVADDHPEVGKPAGNLTIVGQAGIQRIQDLLRRGRFVLLDFSGAQRLAALVDPAKPFDVVCGSLAQHRPELRKVQAMLVRPDGYIAWAIQEPPTQDVAIAALRRWLGKLDFSAVQDKRIGTLA